MALAEGTLFAGNPASDRGSAVTGNILVVEDDRLIRDLISKVLRRDGHSIVEACDGTVALEILQMMHFDLVITDFVMPKVNGLKFVKQLHALQPGLPIIFITGYRSAISRNTMLE